MKYASSIFFIIFMVFIQNSVLAQEEEDPQKGFDKNKLFFGGNFGLSFGNYTLINVSPQIGYRFNRTFAVGTGINFQYSSSKTQYADPIYDYKESYGVVGLNIFGRLYPVDFAFLQVQPELNYTWGKLTFNDGTPEQSLPAKFVPSVLAGAGASIPMGRGAFLAMVQYDLLQQDRSPYGTGVFYNFGYIVGF